MTLVQFLGLSLRQGKRMLIATREGEQLAAIGKREEEPKQQGYTKCQDQGAYRDLLGCMRADISQALFDADEVREILVQGVHARLAEDDIVARRDSPSLMQHSKPACIIDAEFPETR